MAHPITEAEKLIGHGLDPEINPWVKRVMKRAQKKWTEEIKRKHPVTNDNEAANNDNQPTPQDVKVSALFEHIFGEMWQNAERLAGTENAEIYQFAEREAMKELNSTLDSNAMLKLAPDDFMKLRTQMEEIAQAAVKETRDLAAIEKMPLAANTFREKVKNSVKKYVGGKTSPNQVPIPATEQKPAASVPTLSHICGIELRLPTLPFLSQS